MTGDVLLGALIGGVTGLGGVLTAEYLLRQRSRRERLEEAGMDYLMDEHRIGIALLKPYVDTGEDHWATLVRGQAKIRASLKWPVRPRAEIQAQVTRRYISVSVAIEEWHQGKVFTPQEVNGLFDRKLLDLLSLDYGAHIEEIQAQLRADGYPVDEASA